MNLTKLSALDWACWVGALGVLVLLVWANIKFRTGRPKLQIGALPGKGWAEFQVTVTNTGGLPAVISAVTLRCRARSFLGLWREIDLGNSFGVYGQELQFRPLTLRPGESRGIEIGPSGLRPALPKRPLALTIEIRSAHRRRPYRVDPDPTNFNKYAQAMAIKTMDRPA